MTKVNQKSVSRLSKDVFSVIYNTSVEGILAVDTHGVILLANKSCYQLFGYSDQQLIGMKVEELIPIKYKKDHIKHRNGYAQDPKPRKMGQGRDLVALRSDNSEFPIEVSLNHAEHAGKAIVIAFIIDITKRKNTEEALKRSEEKLLQYASELESRVKDRTKELAEAVENLEKLNSQLEQEIKIREKAEIEARKAFERERELNELKSRFVSMASHEFRTPLSTILSSASLIAKYNEKETEDKRLKHVVRIKSNVNDLTGILNDFLSLGKLEEGKIENNPTKFDLNIFLTELLDEIKSGLKSEQSIIYEPFEKNLEVNLDKMHLKSIITNLVSNAIKYSPKQETIKILSYLKKDDLIIDIKDNGIGIPINDQPHLFERFFRAKNVINIQGTGLGLNLVKRHVELINGNISFKSEEGKGSTFSVKLPVKTT